jgi:hypothetical protein
MRCRSGSSPSISWRPHWRPRSEEPPQSPRFSRPWAERQSWRSVPSTRLHHRRGGARPGRLAERGHPLILSWVLVGRTSISQTSGSSASWAAAMCLRASTRAGSASVPGPLREPSSTAALGQELVGPTTGFLEVGQVFRGQHSALPLPTRVGYPLPKSEPRHG